MIGPVIGGVLLTTLGASWVFAINGATFVVSVLLTLSVHGRLLARADAPPSEEEHQGITAGLRFIWRDRPLRVMVVAWIVFVLGPAWGWWPTPRSPSTSRRDRRDSGS